MKKKLSALILTFAIGAASLWVAPPAAAYQRLCYVCTYIWFNGYVCDTDSNGGYTGCNDSGPNCILLGDECLYIVSIHR